MHDGASRSALIFVDLPDLPTGQGNKISAKQIWSYESKNVQTTHHGLYLEKKLRKKICYSKYIAHKVETYYTAFRIYIITGFQMMIFTHLCPENCSVLIIWMSSLANEGMFFLFFFYFIFKKKENIFCEQIV